MTPDILVVDDDRTVGTIVVELLIAKGYQAVHALNGHDALEMFKSGKFKLVITDFKMPKMNGLELCTELKLISNVPVFLCSGSIEEAKEKGIAWKKFDELLYKPITFSLLFKLIQLYLR
jgi:CheY-like chemotaxis protein